MRDTTVLPHQRVALAVIRVAVNDFIERRERLPYFRSRDFAFWCDVAGVDTARARAALLETGRPRLAGRLRAVLDQMES
jgi:hypothetical protein